MNTIKIMMVAGLLSFCSCTKFLDAVPDKSYTVPVTLLDYQQLMENEIMFHNMPELGEFGTDDLYLPSALYASQVSSFRNAYVFAKDVYEGTQLSDWANSYKKLYYANVVISGLNDFKVSQESQKAKDEIKGWALFCRANAHYDLQEVYGMPYRPTSATVDLGIPLKLSSNLEAKFSRATVAQTYSQIITDLNEAALLLPAEFSLINRSKPSKATVYSLLARVHLVMQDYDMALKSADKALELYSVLTNYNTLSASARLPFSPLISEVIYNSTQLNYNVTTWQVDPTLYASYSNDDLRKILFFKEDLTSGTVVFKGAYTAVANSFNGLATDEVFLTRAECYARNGNLNAGLEDLNTVLVNRYKTGKYVPYTTANTTDVLMLILRERRKELIFRNLRWSDLRRLNQDAKFSKTIVHVVNGISYQLPPNDLRYALPLPEAEVIANDLVQNQR